MDALPESSLEGEWRFYASAYRAFFPHMQPHEVDEQEVWVLAMLLGADREVVSDYELTDADRERMERFKQGAEPGTDLTQDIMRQMGIKVT